MADQIRHKTVTVTAGSTPAAPQKTDISFPDGSVERVDIFVPYGAAGLMGLALAVAHQPIIPFETGEWLIIEGERIQFPLEDYPDSGDWQLFAYNQDAFNHQVFVTFLLKLRRNELQIVGGPSPYVAPVVPGTESGGVIVGPAEPPEQLPPDQPPEEPPPDDTPPVEEPPDEIPEPPPPDETPAPEEPPSPDVPDTEAPAPAPPSAPPHQGPIPSPPPELPPPRHTDPGHMVFGYYTELQVIRNDWHVQDWHHYTSGTRKGEKVFVRDLGVAWGAPWSHAAAGWDADTGVIPATRYQRAIRKVQYEQGWSAP